MRDWELQFPLCCDLTAVPVLGMLLGQAQGGPSIGIIMALGIGELHHPSDHHSKWY